MFDYVVTVCEEAKEANCPVFPGVTKRIHWGFEDPAAVQGSHEEKLRAFREIRDKIKDMVDGWVQEITRAMKV